MKINKKIIVAMMVLALLTVSCGKKKPKGNSSTARPVKVQVIGQNQISLGYTASGSIKGIEEIPYKMCIRDSWYSEFSGSCLEVYWKAA